MVHAHLENAEIRIERHPGERQRYAPVIVERGDEACTLPDGDKTRRSISLVVVFPTEPVTAMIWARERRGKA